MKKMVCALLVATVLTTACTKETNGLDDLFSHQGVDDNSKHGGNNNTTVPGAVLAVFNTRYPDAKNIEWKKQSDGTYKAEFYRNGVKWQTTFTASGSIVKEEHD